MAIVLLGVAGLLLAFPSNKYYFCPLHDAFTGQGSCLVSLVSFWLFQPPGIISFSFSSSSQHGQNHNGCFEAPSDCSIHQEYFLSSPWYIQQMVWMMFCDADWSFLHTTGSFFFPYYFTVSWTGDLSFIPFTGTWIEVLTLPFTASRRHVVSSFSAFSTDSFLCCWWCWFPTIYVSLYGFVIFEDKSALMLSWSLVSGV